MGSMDIECPPMLELTCPEYFVTTIGRIEPAGGNNLRLYLCVKKGGVLEPMFSVVMPIAELAKAARVSLIAASEHHNDLTIKNGGTEH
jgi:hypothetical protein